MSDTADLKCSCVHCNGRIAFPPAAAGSTINCPHCSKPTLLQAPAAPASSADGTVKCACQHCNGRIAYPPHAAGSIITCPHCGKQTVLGQAAAAVAAPAAVAPPPPVAAPVKRPMSVGKPHEAAATLPPPATPPAKRPAPPVPSPESVAEGSEGESKGKKSKPAFINCTACGTQISVKAKACPSCGAPVARPKLKFAIIALIIVAIIGLGAGVFLVVKKGGGAGAFLGGGGDLKVDKFELTKVPGTTLVHVTGTVKNRSDQQFQSVRIDFKLLDKSNKQIGTATDFIMLLEPKSEWTFKAQVLETEAVKAELDKVSHQSGR